MALGFRLYVLFRATTVACPYLRLLGSPMPQFQVLNNQLDWSRLTTWRHNTSVALEQFRILEGEIQRVTLNLTHLPMTYSSIKTQPSSDRPPAMALT